LALISKKVAKRCLHCYVTASFSEKQSQVLDGSIYTLPMHTHASVHAGRRIL